MTRKGNQLNKIIKTEMSVDLWSQFSSVCRGRKVSCAQMTRNLIAEYVLQEDKRDTASTLRNIGTSKTIAQVSERDIDTFPVARSTSDTTGEAREDTNSDSTHIVSR